MSKQKLNLTIRADVGKMFAPYLRSMLRRVNTLLRKPLDELTVVLVNDAVMSDLHQRFMGISGPTDVLTFPMDDSAGEVVICVAEARRRAREQDIPVRDEVLLYAIHGMLHLAGLDDRTPRGFKQMHLMEDQILTQLGVGPVFNVKARVPKPLRRPRQSGGSRR